MVAEQKRGGKFTSARNVGTAFFRQLDPPLSLCSVTCFVLATERLIFSESFAVAIQNSERRVLPVMNEIIRKLRNMGLILVFLFVSWCSIIFFGRTFKISSVVSKVAVFVAGVITRLFF